MALLKNIRKDLKSLADPAKAKDLQWFFKTGPGEYGFGDKFMGITNPKLRVLAKKHYESIDFKDLKLMLSSKFHEERLLAIFILVLKYKKANLAQQKRIYNFYFANVSGVNNWDLVDQSAYHLIGAYLFDKDKSFLYKLVKSKSLWRRRIAIIATLYFIRNDDFDDALKLATELLNDKEDLMHKATGWVLREVGKRDFKALTSYLSRHYQSMPRTMLRYAIERFPEKLRKAYLHGKV